MAVDTLATPGTDRSPEPRANPTIGLAGTLSRLRPYLWPIGRPDLRIRIVAAFGLLLLAKVVTVVTPFSFKWATDALVAVAGKGEAAAGQEGVPLWAGPVGLTLAYGVLRGLQALLTQLRDGVFAQVAMHAVRSVAQRTFEHMHALSLRFHLDRKTGGLTRVLERGRNGIEELSRLLTLTLVPTAIEFAMVIGIMAWEFSWLYALATGVTVAIYLVFTFAATEWRIGIRRQMNESDTDANVRAIDSLLNFETVKYFGAERREAERYDRSLARYERASVQSYVSLAVLNGGQAVIFAAGMCAVMLLAVRDIEAGRTSIGGFVMVNAMLIQLAIPLNFIGMIYRQIKQSLIDIEDMFGVLDRDPEIRDVPGAPALRVDRGEVRFENVRFGYGPAREILHGISFTVPAGHTVAVVGPSGAGKSTISRLLFRFYEPTGGRILIDGQDIATVRQESLRAALGMVPQDTVLFNDTVGYNIRYGRAEADDAAVEEAARLARIDGFIELLPEGYRTPVGERGLKLSGGEKQRVAIARTILKAPPILVLDEATSALDSFTEKEIQDALDRVARDRTAIVIAHRLSTVVDADEILVLDAGRIVERGRHAALIGRGGVYAAMWDRQRRAAEARDTLVTASAAEAPSLRETVGD